MGILADGEYDAKALKVNPQLGGSVQCKLCLAGGGGVARFAAVSGLPGRSSSGIPGIDF